MAFTTTSELALHCEREIGHQLTGASTQRADVLSHLDRAHKIVLSGGGILNYSVDGRRLRNEVVFSFARSKNPKILTLLPAVTTALVTATRQSNAISFSADPNSGVSIANYFIRINGEEEVYRVSSHTAASTSAILDSEYVGTANVVNASSTIFKRQYDVGASDILQLISPIRSYSSERQEDKISVVDKDELLEQIPLRLTTQCFPKLAAIVYETAGTLTLEFSSYPNDLERIEIEYIPIPVTLDTTSVDPILPAQHRLILSHLAAHYMSTRNDDARAATHLSIARDMFADLVEWNEKLNSSGDPDFGRIRIAGGFHSTKSIGIQRGFILSR